MYGFQNDLLYPLTAERILKMKPDSVLWRYYLGQDFQLGKSIKAPYRVDNNPSFLLSYNSLKNKIIGRDYANGFVGDIFDYIQMVYKINFHSALLKINSDFDLGLSGQSFKTSGPNIQEKNKAEVFKVRQENSFIQFKPRNYSKQDGEYWKQYGISGKTLVKYNVWPAEKIWQNKSLLYLYKKEDPCYVFVFPKTEYRNKEHLKCYWPLRQNFRFIGNCSNDRDVQGYDQCKIAKKDHGSLLILTKSLKDCMVFHELGIDSMATHGEAHRFSSDFIRHLKKYYTKVISLYDRDITGMIGGSTGKGGARYLWKEFQIRPYFIDKKYKSKDISDLYKNHGKETTQNFLKKII